MKIYDETLEHELTDPDLTKGRLEDAQRTIHHPAQPRKTHREVMPGTVTAARPAGLLGVVEDAPCRSAWDERENVQRYIPYTQDELDAMAAAEKAAQEAAEAQARQDAENAAKLARIDAIDAQVTYTALMTDTLIEEG